MPRLKIVVAAIALIAGGWEAGESAQAGAIPNSGLSDVATQSLPLGKVQFSFGGYSYCWYADAWNGPGFYYCGYPWTYGWGWGGGWGWNGWKPHHYVYHSGGGGFNGGGIYHGGGHHVWHNGGGGFNGGGIHHGGGHHVWHNGGGGFNGGGIHHGGAGPGGKPQSLLR